MKIKNWKRSPKYRKKSYTMWINTLPKYKPFHDSFYLTIGTVGMTDRFYVSVSKSNVQIKVKEFDNHKKAEKFAKSYMRRHKG